MVTYTVHCVNVSVHVVNSSVTLVTNERYFLSVHVVNSISFNYPLE